MGLSPGVRMISKRVLAVGESWFGSNVWVKVANLGNLDGAFPAFLIAREIRISKSDAPGIRAIDAILLAVVAILTALLTIWIDLG